MSRNAAESELCFDLRAAHICTRIYPRFLSDSGEIRYKASAHNAVNSLRASWKSAVRKRHLCYGGRSWNCNYQTVRYFEIKIIFKFFVYVTAYTIAIWNSSLLTNFSEYSNIKFHENPLRLLMPRSEQSNTHGDANRRILAKVQFVTRMWIIYIYILTWTTLTVGTDGRTWQVYQFPPFMQTEALSFTCALHPVHTAADD